MARGAIFKIEPMYVAMEKPSPQAKLVGNTRDGLPIYEIEKPVFINRPEIGPDGQPVYSRNPMTGDRMVQQRVVEVGKRKMLVIPNNQGNGNLSWDEYIPPSEEELRAAKRQKAIREMTDSLAAALVDADLTPDALLAALGDATGAAGVKEGPIGDAGDGDEEDEGYDVDEPVVMAAEGEAIEYPYHKGGGNYLLSDGSTVKGRKDARRAQRRLDEGLPPLERATEPSA